MKTMMQEWLEVQWRVAGATPQRQAKDPSWGYGEPGKGLGPGSAGCGKDLPGTLRTLAGVGWVGRHRAGAGVSGMLGGRGLRAALGLPVACRLPQGQDWAGLLPLTPSVGAGPHPSSLSALLCSPSSLAAWGPVLGAQKQGPSSCTVPGSCSLPHPHPPTPSWDLMLGMLLFL